MGTNSSRLETLTDGIFAIAMTLLVLDLKIEGGFSHVKFINTVRQLWPQFFAFVVSFMVLAVYWIGHHNQYFWIKHSDRIFIWINVFFLMTISFLPFSTSLIASYPHEIYSVVIYGTNVSLAGIILYIHWKYAVGKGNLVEGELDRTLSKSIENRILLGIIFYMIAMGLSIFSTILSIIMFAILPFFYMPFSRIDKFLKEQHQEHI